MFFAYLTISYFLCNNTCSCKGINNNKTAYHILYVHRSMVLFGRLYKKVNVLQHVACVRVVEKSRDMFS